MTVTYLVRNIADRHRNPSYSLRLDADLKESLSRLAAQNGRSLHEEVVHALGHYVRKRARAEIRSGDARQDERPSGYGK